MKKTTISALFLASLFISVAFFIPSTACTSPKEKDSTHQINTSAETQATGIQFFKGTFKEALSKAKAEKKMIFLDAYTTWCGPCKLLQKQIFPDAELGAYYNQNFINIKIDMESGEGSEIAEMLAGQGHELQGYPSLFYLDSSGNVKDVMIGVPPRGAADLLSFAKKLK